MQKLCKMLFYWYCIFLIKRVLQKWRIVFYLVHHFLSCKTKDIFSPNVLTKQEIIFEILNHKLDYNSIFCILELGITFCHELKKKKLGEFSFKKLFVDYYFVKIRAFTQNLKFSQIKRIQLDEKNSTKPQ